MVNTGAGRGLRQARLRVDRLRHGARGDAAICCERGVRVTGTDGWSWDAPFVHTKDATPRPATPADLGGPQGRPRDRLLPHREAAQSRSSCPPTGFMVSLLSGEDPRRLGRLDPRRRDPRLVNCDRMTGCALRAWPTTDRHNEGRHQAPGTDIMDRRKFVAGSAATAAALGHQAVIRSGRLSARPVTMINPFPPGGANDLDGPAAGGDPRADHQAAGGDRDQGRGRRRGRRALRRQRQARRLHPAVAIVSISGFAEVDKLFGRPPKSTRDDFIPIARFVADPMVLIVNVEQPFKTLEELIDDAKKTPDESSVQLVRALRRAASADRAVHEVGRHQAAASADQWRRAGADRAPWQQCAGPRVRRSRRPMRNRRPARCARSRCSAASALAEFCLMCRL